MDLSLVVLAAGMGSRYGALKQMDPFGPMGETLIEYSIFDAIQAGFNNIVFVIRDSFREAFVDKFEGILANQDGVSRHYVSQELDDLPEGFYLPEGREKPWGTGHAVWVTRHVVKGPFAVINADDFYGRDAYQTLSEFLMETKDDTLYSTVAYLLENTLSDHGTVNRGVCQSKDEYLTRVDERLKIRRHADGKIYYNSGEDAEELPEGTLVSMNMWGFTPLFFKDLDHSLVDFFRGRINEAKSELYIPAVVQKGIDEGTRKVRVLTSRSNWFGVTYQEDKPVVMQKIRDLHTNGAYPGQLWSS